MGRGCIDLFDFRCFVSVAEGELYAGRRAFCVVLRGSAVDGAMDSGLRQADGRSYGLGWTLCAAAISDFADFIVHRNAWTDSLPVSVAIFRACHRELLP